VQRFPDRFVGLTLVNLNRGREGVLAELERGRAMGLRGVKLIAHYQGQPDDHPLVEAACRWADERGQIILNHSWGSLEHLQRMLRACPSACLITGHTRTDVGDLVRRHSNLFVCGMPLHQSRDTEEAVAKLGADRILFGSDLTDLPIPWVLGPVLFARIPGEQKRLILGGNLQRILERYSKV
jgi:predicted TIM-barrel fold metal-dependent hydrolase